MPLVSVIVAVYNGEKHIEKCCAHLLNQTFKDYEVIFVNDGSTDSSLKLLTDYQKQYANIKVFSKENGGQASARNLGIDEAKGEWICFIDIDDQITMDYLEKFIACSKQTQAEVIWCNANKIKGNEVSLLDDEIVWTNDSHVDFFLHNASPWRKMIKTSLIKENDLYFPSIRFYEDIVVAAVYGLFTDKVAYIKEPLYDYYLHEGSTMHQQTYNKKLEDIFVAMDLLKKNVERSQYGNIVHDELEFIYISHLLHAASLRFFQFENTEQQLERVIAMLKENFPNWKQNQYYRLKDWKFKFVCHCFYHKNYWILKMILK